MSNFVNDSAFVRVKTPLSTNMWITKHPQNQQCVQIAVYRFPIISCRWALSYVRFSVLLNLQINAYSLRPVNISWSLFFVIQGSECFQKL